jgi:flagellar biosynthesis protein FlhG
VLSPDSAHRARADQASGLRRLLEPPAVRLVCLAAADPARGARYACAVAEALDAAGEVLLMLDATRGTLARAAGVASRYELMHVLDAARRLDEVMYAVGAGVPVLPAARGLRALAGAWRARERLAAILRCAGGSPRLALAFADARAIEPLAALADGRLQTHLILTSPAATELRAAYGILKRLQALRLDASLVIDAGLPPAQAQALQQALSRTALDFLGRAPRLLGRLAPQELAQLERDPHV